MGCRSSEKREGLTHCTQEGPNVTKSAYLLWIEKNRKANKNPAQFMLTNRRFKIACVCQIPWKQKFQSVCMSAFSSHR